MPDRERLIELIRKAKKNTKGANCDLEREMLFADFLLENGVIVPPCKAGDTVYFLDVRSLTIRKLEVATILISSPKAILLHLTDGYLHGAYDYGISLFHTDKEAEEAIKKYFIQKGM